MPYFIHKHEVAQAYGGAEEGGWWYDSGVPVEDWAPMKVLDEERAYELCRDLNEAEDRRAKKEEQYGYTSVLSHLSTHYAYSVHETSVMTPYPEYRPFYE